MCGQRGKSSRINCPPLDLYKIHTVHTFCLTQVCTVCIFVFMKTTELVKRLKGLGFQEVGGKKHIKYRHPDGRWTVISKGSHEISVDLLKNMEKQIKEKLT